MRTMRLADGPDEVHNRTIARLEYKKIASNSGGAEEPDTEVPGNR